METSTKIGDFATESSAIMSHSDDANPEEGIKKYGHATFADPVNKKYPIRHAGPDQGGLGLYPPAARNAWHHTFSSTSDATINQG